ncbi:class I SAM-dependent methyltransferase [Sediminicoccus sp. KRV36]|uniref:class I SAM-dependent methyltransferase n=1 Tax=Sediminicoccus sp. KRV36 TaxID=3133721 RepID=UPI00200D2794|nr:class I SAM-dependent methyltransferase [Sediminicoccus rosea]UPY35364.1 class I SAM-dependent methyltransferase [Sediminicoccus rosea]
MDNKPGVESFDGDWLALREPFDAMARNQDIARALMEHLDQKGRPRFLDLGAGTGSLTRWLGHFVGRAHAWVLADADAELMSRAFDTLMDSADSTGWRATWPQRKVLLLHPPEGAWRIEGVLTNLADAPDGLPLENVDAVTCSALCDLVSEAWLLRLAAELARRRLPFYAALNVAGHERFMPPCPGDALVARGFARDQRRVKGFGGVALGAAAPDAIARIFTGHGYRVLRGASPWIIPRQEGHMAHELAMGHAEAALRHEKRGAKQIWAWADARTSHYHAGVLSARVAHQDVLCLPG